jgi:D-sedoheptulose 7-phosphate isomerase
MSYEVFGYRDELLTFFQDLDARNWNQACEILLDAYSSQKIVWIGGNGGNASNAHHFATDWTKGLYKHTGQALRSHTLWDNPSLVSAFSNDQEFSLIYSDQLSIFANTGDITVLMSGGGASPNVIQAAKRARALGLLSIGLTGGDGHTISHLFDCHIHVPTDNIQIVEDIHATFGHTVMKFIINRHLESR